MTSTHRSSPRRAIWIIGMLALALSIASVSLIHQYGATRPSVGDTRHTHAVKIHARIVYLTRGEYALAFVSHTLTVVAIGSFLGVLLKSRIRKSSDLA